MTALRFALLIAVVALAGCGSSDSRAKSTEISCQTGEAFVCSREVIMSHGNECVAWRECP